MPDLRDHTGRTWKFGIIIEWVGLLLGECSLGWSASEQLALRLFIVGFVEFQVNGESSMSSEVTV